MKRTLFSSLTVLITGTTFAAIADDNAIFTDTSLVADSATLVNTKSAAEVFTEKKSLGFSGKVNSFFIPSFSRSILDNEAFESVPLTGVVVANGLVDARLKGGEKAYADLEFAAQSDSTPSYAVRELFLDAAINNHVYFRAGKQVLQWGVCELWNPTDLVNVQRKTFVPLLGDPEGTFGLKMTIPYKTLFNFYSFIDANDAQTFHDVAGAVKAEALFDRTELALSAWKKDGKKPVFGLDVTSRVFTMQVAGEIALRNGADMPTLDLSGAVPHVTTLDTSWFPRAALTLSRTFPLAGVPDRVSIAAEGYYNYAGYDTNIFNDPRVRGFSNITELAKGPLPLLALYEPNSYSKYYGFLSGSVGQCFIEQLTATFSVLANFNQNCYVLMPSISYASLNDFSAGVTLIAAVGPEHTEYTTLYDALTIRLQAGVRF